jgi:hypothetical protein
MSNKTIEQCVQAGMQFLDKHISNWTDAIDLERLDLGDCTLCVIGQLYKDCWGGIARLDIDLMDDDYTAAEALGFYRTDVSTYDELTYTWFEAIKKRKEEQNV